MCPASGRAGAIGRPVPPRAERTPCSPARASAFATGSLTPLLGVVSARRTRESPVAILSAQRKKPVSHGVKIIIEKISNFSKKSFSNTKNVKKSRETKFISFNKNIQQNLAGQTGAPGARAAVIAAGARGLARVRAPAARPAVPTAQAMTTSTRIVPSSVSKCAFLVSFVNIFFKYPNKLFPLSKKLTFVFDTFYHL